MESAQDVVADNGEEAPPVGQSGSPAAGAQDWTGHVMPSARQSVAARLVAARDALGLTSDDIAARTRINKRHVVALEQGDFSTLPGRPYVLGFVRSYARVVGLNERDLAADVRDEFEAVAPRPEPPVFSQLSVDDPAKTPSSLVTWLALALFIVILAAGSVYWRSYYWPGAALPSLVTPTEAAPPPPVRKPAPVAAPAAPAAPSGPVVFTALEEGIWVKFYDGAGKQLLQKQLAKGETFTVPADAVDPKLWTGRPEALAITIGGQAIAPLADKQQTMKDVPVSAAALLARTAPAASATPVAAASAAPAPAVSPAVSSVPGVSAGTVPGSASPGHPAATVRRPLRHRVPDPEADTVAAPVEAAPDPQ